MEIWNEGKIFPPSPLRLLCIARVGWHCEQKECPGNHLTKHRKDYGFYGLFFCCKCTLGAGGGSSDSCNIVDTRRRDLMYIRSIYMDIYQVDIYGARYIEPDRTRSCGGSFFKPDYIRYVLLYLIPESAVLV